MNIQGPHICLLSSQDDSCVMLDTENNFVYLTHSCLWLCFSEREFRSFVGLINDVDYRARRDVFPYGKEGVLIRSPLPGIGFRLEETDVILLQSVLNKALKRLNYRTVTN